jgi:hypothetical protein
MLIHFPSQSRPSCHALELILLRELRQCQKTDNERLRTIANCLIALTIVEPAKNNQKQLRTNVLLEKLVNIMDICFLVFRKSLGDYQGNFSECSNIHSDMIEVPTDLDSMSAMFDIFAKISQVAKRVLSYDQTIILNFKSLICWIRNIFSFNTSKACVI